jgi:UDP-N-acetylmuramyl pentapeptide phosphotransferase/UDP-N-acetylglucosamine-1-phosphate transferase
MTDGFAGLAVSQWWLAPLVAIAAVVISAGAITLIRPPLLKHLLARPNARSSHQAPTPQGAGIAVIVATLIVAGATLVTGHVAHSNFPAWLFGATLFIAAIGFADDIKPIPVLPRLLLQAAVVSAVVMTSLGDLRIAPFIPHWIERGLLLLAGVWFINLVNFMDGLDWMTVAEVVPITAAMAMLGLSGEFPPTASIVAATLCGAMIGFAPFNRPVAKIFLGDVGSLPIGLLLGWCLLQLTGQHHLAAALLLPLYYLADATVTLLRRIMRHEPFWIAHRSHFYQRATDNGFTVLQVVSEVFVLNLVLAALAVISIKVPSPAMDAALIAAGIAAVIFTLYRFSQPRRS